MQELKLTVPTYYGAANCKRKIVGDPPDFDSPDVPVLIHEAEGVRVVFGTHDFSDGEKPDIQIERRPNGWAIFLHPVGGGDASGYVYFLDDGRSFLLREQEWAREGSIEVLPGPSGPAEIDEIELPQPDVRGPSPVDQLNTKPTPEAGPNELKPPDIPMQMIENELCARCGQLTEVSGDWYDGLCPGCADETDGDWICGVCGQCGTFEAMGVEGDSNPACCGVPCKRVDDDDPVDEENPSR